MHILLYTGIISECFSITTEIYETWHIFKPFVTTFAEKKYPMYKYETNIENITIFINLIAINIYQMQYLRQNTVSPPIFNVKWKDWGC